MRWPWYEPEAVPQGDYMILVAIGIVILISIVCIIYRRKK
jgi:hypothetical protein